MIEATLKPCIAPRFGPNVCLAGKPRLVAKLHRPWPGGVGFPARANSSLVPRGAQTTAPTPTACQIAPSSQPVRLRNKPVKSYRDSNRQSEKQHLANAQRVRRLHARRAPISEALNVPRSRLGATATVLSARSDRYVMSPARTGVSIASFLRTKRQPQFQLVTTRNAKRLPINHSVVGPRKLLVDLVKQILSFEERDISAGRRVAISESWMISANGAGIRG